MLGEPVKNKSSQKKKRKKVDIKNIFLKKLSPTSLRERISNV